MNDKNIASEPTGCWNRIWHFLTVGIWEVEIHTLSTFKRIGINFIRIVHLVLKGYMENECPLQASALTFNSLMALVPIAAIALAVLRGLNAGEWAEAKILASIAQMPPQFQEFISRIIAYVKNTNFATLGGLGFIFLFWVVVQVLSCVEASFNRVWGATTQRPLLRKISDYLSITMVVPVLILAATTINATLMSSTIAEIIANKFGLSQTFYSNVLSLTPFFVTWMAFLFLYKYMPNTTVNMMPAIVSSLIGGSLWIAWQWFYIKLQIGVSQYNAIYATFASVPIFLLWLYISWQIILLGAEIGFAIQNYATYQMEQKAHSASTQSRIMLALSILSHAAMPMIINVPMFDVQSYSKKHKIPVRLINEVLEVLVKSGLMVEVADRPNHFVLCKTPDSIFIKDVLEIITQAGASPKSLGLETLNPAIRHILGRVDAGTGEALKNFSLTNLLHLHSRLSEENKRVDLAPQ